MEKKYNFGVQQIADGIIGMIRSTAGDIRLLDKERKKLLDEVEKEMSTLKSLGEFHHILVSTFIWEKGNADSISTDEFIDGVNKELIIDVPPGSIILPEANGVTNTRLVDIDGFKRVTKEMLDHIAKLEFENDQLANHRLDPFYEPNEEVKETVDHIVEEYKDEIKEVFLVSKDADECRGRFSFVDPKEVYLKNRKSC
ncbi:hypothetical protein [Bacillus safensis]|uniref:hypothetical protein n=1 Tax=Bacillus safensis TaxID=561879 RepID=UPI002280275D|nr:hypothetical protein [Bacillus safensis]MCY7479794.1 hypothetical protein [Bacillus safensis]MCY7513643.1 hypothetical protein [Bacillus safensis]MED0719134.1 hypothetical protein [Bacillus safensis]MED4747519.1 hypothetical protein [Bacillus safensis]